MNKGIVFTLSAYIFWGLHPVYWKILKQFPAEILVSHRIIWSFVFFALIILFKKNFRQIVVKIKSAPSKLKIIIPAFLIGLNWGVYIWAVNAGFILETSMGYFISPLLSIFLGVFYLNEKLRPLQWVSISIAAAGVIVMTLIYGQFPFVALILAVSWAIYGLMRKNSVLTPVEGLAFETVILVIPALIYLLSVSPDLSRSFNYSPVYILLLMGSGIISGAPLIIYITGIRLIRLSLVGILQYIYPTLIFLVGYIIYSEPVNSAKMAGFIFIWIALLIYSFESSIYLRRKRPVFSE